MKVINQIYLIKVHFTLVYQFKDCNELQLVFAPKQLD